MMKIKTTKQTIKITFKFKRNDFPVWLRRKLIGTLIPLIVFASHFYVVTQ